MRCPCGYEFESTRVERCPLCGEARPEDKVKEASTHRIGGVPDNRDSLRGADENQVEYEKAGFWIRFGAVFVDFTLFSLALDLVGGPATASGASTNIIPYCVFFILYPILCVGAYGQTLGKKLFGLRVLRTDFSRVSYGWAFLRWIGYWLSMLILGFGYFMVGWAKEKQGLHDKLAKTFVVIDPWDSINKIPILLRIIGVFSILGGLQVLATMVRSFPVAFFGLMLTGTGAKLLGLISGSVAIYIGLGLLRLWRKAWIIAIVYHSYGIANALLSIPLAPKIAQLIQQTMAQPNRVASQALVRLSAEMAIIVGVAVGGLILAYLIAKRELFLNPTRTS